MMWHKLSRFLTASLATLGILAGSAGAASAEVVFHRGNDGDPETLDAHKTQTTSEANLLRDLSEGLVIHNPKGEVVPGVALSWATSPDAKTYTFKLRTDAKWSNGDPVKASDFVYSFRRIMNPATGAKYANILYPLLNGEKINKGQEKNIEALGVKAIDDHTLEIKLERATPYFIELLTHQTGLPVHPASVDKHGPNFVKPENWVSNGAFVLKEFVPNSHIKMTKNPHFHDAKNVQIDTIMYFPGSDLAAMSRRFQAGELHFTVGIPADQVKFLKEKLGSQVSIAPYLGTFYLTFNTTKAPFNDARVRTALSLAIDREFLSEKIWSGTMLPAYSFVPPGIGNYREPAYVDWKSMSPIDREDKAKALLKEAGFGPGGKKLAVEIRYNMTDNNKNTVVAVGDMWKQLGVEVTFISTDGKTHFAHLREGKDFDVARAGWIGDYSDPQNFLFLGLSDNALNYAHYKNPEFDALVRKAEETADLDKRAQVLFEAEKIWMKDQPIVPLFYYSTMNLVSPKLKGFVPNLRGAFASRYFRIEP